MRVVLKRYSILAVTAGVASLIAAACSQLPGSPTPSQATAVVSDGTRVVGTSAGSTPVAGEVIICKVGNVSGTFTVETTAGGSVVSPVTIAPGQCEDVGEAASTTGATFTVTETSAGLQSVTRNPVVAGGFANGGSVFINSIHGVVLTFTNNVVTNTGIQGCSPGYWKQSHHFDSWPAAFKPTDSFNATFGIGTDWFPNSFTLVNALANGGGGANALGRQAVAALLSAAKGFYPFTTSEVIAKIQAAYADGSLINLTEQLLDLDNNLGCPLN
jgi:hypothetical protein